MGSGKGAQQSSQPQQVNSTTTTSNIPDYAKPYFESLLNRAQQTSNDPYQAYGGNRIAPLTNNQQTAIGLGSANVGNYQPYFNQANQSLQQAGSFDPTQVNNSYVGQNYNPQTWIDPNVASSYMSPFQQNVTDIAKRESNRDFGVAQQIRNTQAQQGGAFGGYRQGIVDAEAQRNQGQLLNDIQQQGLQSAYTTGLGAFNQDRSALIGANQLNNQFQQQQAQLGMAAEGANNQYGLSEAQLRAGIGQAFQGLGQAQQQAGAGDITQLLNTGAIQQAQTQNQYDTAYQDFLNQRSYPWQTLNQFSGILRGVPVSANSDVTGYQAPPSQISQITGLGLGAAGLSKLLS